MRHECAIASHAAPLRGSLKFRFPHSTLGLERLCDRANQPDLEKAAYEVYPDSRNCVGRAEFRCCRFPDRADHGLAEPAGNIHQQCRLEDVRGARCRREQLHPVYADVTGLTKDDKSIWRGKATKDGKPVSVALDYQGNIVSQ
jgi:hypothetical protein